jgi:hypothetical protein
VLEDDTAWTWGDNWWGQLGDGTTEDRHSPVQVSNLGDVEAIEAWQYHTAALQRDGTVWTWGKNWAGELGDGTTEDRTSPVQVVGLTDATAVAVGRLHTLALRPDGTVWVWGGNRYDQLGDAATGDHTTPILVPGLTHVVAVAALEFYSMALRSDGTVWTWGDNTMGQLGDGTTSQRSTPAPVTGLSGVVAMAPGACHAAALRVDGTVWAWGRNYAGQLGDGTYADHFIAAPAIGLTDAVAVAAGWEHTLAVRGLPGQKLLACFTIGGGTVELNPPGGLYAANNPVSLTAQPDPGWQFSHWEGDLAGSYSPAMLVMDRYKSVTAVFTSGQPPDAHDDIATVPMDTPGQVIDVLINDMDPEADPLVVIAVTAPSHGSAVSRGDYVHYTPEPGYIGPDTFDYTILDGHGGSDTASVTAWVLHSSGVNPPGELRLDMRPLIDLTLNTNGPAPRSLGIIKLEPNNPPGTRVAIHIAGGATDAWLRIDPADGRVYPDPQADWQLPEAWANRRIVGLAPHTEYTFSGQARNAQAQTSDPTVVATERTNRAGDVNRSGRANALDYAHVKHAILRDEFLWPCDVDDSGALDGGDLDAVAPRILGP